MEADRHDLDASSTGGDVSPMDVELITTTEGLDRLREDWEELEQRDPEATYYVAHRFVRAWWAGYEEAPGYLLRIVCWRQGGTLVGIAPLAVMSATQDGRPVGILRWATHGDYMTVLADPTARDTVYKAFLEFLDRGDGWHTINLAGVPGHGSLAHHLLKSSYNRHFSFVVENPYIDLKEVASLEEFVDRSVPKKTRKYRNKLLREKDVQFRIFRGDEDNILERIAEVHVAEKRHLIEHKGRTERHSLYEDARRLGHVRAVFTGTSDPVTFGYVEPDGRLIGYRTTYEYRRTLLSWNSGYLPEYGQYRIGKVIQYDIVAELLATRSHDVFDLGAGRYQWKFEWTSLHHPTYRIYRRLIEPASKPATPHTTSPAAAPAADPAAATSPSRTGLSAIRARLSPVKKGVQAVTARVRRTFSPPIIWYIAHADDETIFMGGSVARNRDRRNILVVLTRGGGSRAIDKVAARLGRELSLEEFMRGRERELYAAIAHLGVRPEDVFQHDLPDGAVSVDDAYTIIAEQARQQPRAAHRTLSYIDPHPDHRAAGQALRRAHDEGIAEDVLFFLPVPVLAAQEFTRAPLGVADVAAKRAALEEYRLWDPEQGRLAIGSLSVPDLIANQLANPRERVHTADLPIPTPDT